VTEPTPPTGRDEGPDEADRPLDAQAPEVAGGEEPPPDVPDIMKQTTA
jgi:hypothetical protein